MASLAKLSYMSMKVNYVDKQSLSTYLNTKIGFLYLPFENDYQQGEVFVTTSQQANPFKPSENIEKTMKTTLTSMNESTKIANIEQVVEMDLEAFVAGMKQMMEKLLQALAPEKMKDFDFQMDMDMNQQISYDTQSTWVQKSVSTVEVIATEATTGKTKKTIIITSTVE